MTSQRIEIICATCGASLLKSDEKTMRRQLQTWKTLHAQAQRKHQASGCAFVDERLFVGGKELVTTEDVDRALRMQSVIEFEARKGRLP